jgi:hypothetical protein
MKRIRRLAAITLLGVAAVCGAQINMPNPGAPGGSFNSAVRIVATSDLMVDRFIARWLRTHYPGWQAEPHEFTDMGDERYAVVYITHTEHPARRVYFRVVQSHADPEGRDASSPFPF